MAILLGQARQVGALVICAPVYAELLAYPKVTNQFVQNFLTNTGIQTDFSLNQAVWQQAGEAFANYAKQCRNSSGGQPKRLLVDFLVGAHALLETDRLITLDPKRYQNDFPNLVIKS